MASCAPHRRVRFGVYRNPKLSPQPLATSLSKPCHFRLARLSFSHRAALHTRVPWHAARTVSARAARMRVHHSTSAQEACRD
eukprot:4277525-Alexandrium_andersonii.AAC.1